MSVYLITINIIKTTLYLNFLRSFSFRSITSPAAPPPTFRATWKIRE